MAAMLYFFLSYCLFYFSWSHATQHSSQHSLAKPRKIYLMFTEYLTDIQTVPGERRKIPRTTCQLVLTNEDEAARPSTTTISLSRMPWTGPVLYSPIMVTNSAPLPESVSNANSTIGYFGYPLPLEYHSDAAVRKTAYEVGTTTTQNAEIINPENGAGILVNVLENNPYISKTFPGSEFLTDVHDDLEGYEDRLEVHVRALQLEKWKQYRSSEKLLEKDYNRFPVPIIMSQKVDSEGRPTDVMLYNILDHRHPRRIPASSSSALVHRLLQHVVEEHSAPRSHIVHF